MAITEPGARTVEVDTPSGWTLPEWQAYATRYHAPGCAVTPIAGLPPSPSAPINLDEALAAACEGVVAITPEVFRSLLSREDLDDIEAGDIPPETVRQYEQAAIAREVEDLRGFFEERASIIEHDGLPCPEAELEAARITATLARNRGYLWASLREALKGYPALASTLPATDGKVDSLALGVATVHVRKGRSAVRQGTFVGPHHVTTTRADQR